MVCAAAVSVDVESVACEFEPTAPEPSVAAPSLNVTIPVGTPLAAEVIVAVNVTVCPNVEGFMEVERSVVEAAVATAVTGVLTLLLPLAGSACTPETWEVAVKVPADAAVTLIT